MKRIIVICIGIIIISNGIWSYLYFNNRNKSEFNNGVHLFTLDGSGKQWDIEGYKILISPDKILRGDAKLIFKGDPSDVDKSTYYSLQFKERINDKDEVVYSTSASSPNGSVSLLRDLSSLGSGSITSPYSDGELTKDKRTYESTSLTITWNDNNGKNHTETIDLDSIREISIKDDD